MNVLLVSSEYPPETARGGLATYTHHLARGLVQQGHRVRVLSASVTDEPTFSEVDSIRVYRVPNVWPLAPFRKLRLAGLAHILGWSWTFARGVERLSEQEPPDIVEMPLWDAQSLVYGIRPYVPLVVRAETPKSEVARVSGFQRRWWAVNLWGGAWLEALAVRRATRVIAISHAIANTIINDYHVPTEKIRITYLGLPLPAVVEAKRDKKVITFLFVGRLEPRKGIQSLLQAIPRVVAALPDARFLIAGRDVGIPLSNKSYRSYFEETAGLQALAATSFLGYVDQLTLEQLYAACDIFVAPSLYESFGLVHLEAMSYGKPVVAFRSGATPELVEDGVTGLLVPPSDVQALAEALLRLGLEPEIRSAMGKAGADRVQSRFSVDAMVESTVAVYREACEVFYRTTG